MLLGIIDTETTGLDSESEICEFSITVYKVGLTREETGAITSFSSILPITKNDVEEVNWISPQLSQNSKQFYEQSIAVFKNLVLASDYCVAFNAAFDKEKLMPLIGEQKWICAMTDFEWGYRKGNSYGSFRLIDLALWLGIGISTHHRAGDDVRLLVECLNRIPNIMEFVEKGIARSQSPVLEIQALVEYNNRDLAKNAYFIWVPDRKVWVKNVKECDLAVLLNKLPFQCKTLKVVE